LTETASIFLNLIREENYPQKQRNAAKPHFNDTLIPLKYSLICMITNEHSVYIYSILSEETTEETLLQAAETII
jgi:hypothetical protein